MPQTYHYKISYADGNSEEVFMEQSPEELEAIINSDPNTNITAVQLIEDKPKKEMLLEAPEKKPSLLARYNSYRKSPEHIAKRDARRAKMRAVAGQAGGYIKSGASNVRTQIRAKVGPMVNQPSGQSGIKNMLGMGGGMTAGSLLGGGQSSAANLFLMPSQSRGVGKQRPSQAALLFMGSGKKNSGMSLLGNNKNTASALFFGTPRKARKPKRRRRR